MAHSNMLPSTSDEKAYMNALISEVTPALNVTKQFTGLHEKHHIPALAWMENTRRSLHNAVFWGLLEHTFNIFSQCCLCSLA